MFTIEGTDRIYSEKTKSYFSEILSSYFSGNYRSAIVLLYSVTVTDIFLKLNELDTVYNDGVARGILTEVRKMKENDKNSEWEKALVDKVYNAHLISQKLYSDISHLYSDRCFSAHPSLDDNYELVSPSKEMAFAHIKNILDGLFTAPPTFNKNLIGMITDDLEKRKETFIDDDDKLKKYLLSAYYERMTDFSRVSLFKSLWTFCFNKPDDEQCRRNCNINIRALIILCDSFREVLSDAKKSNFVFSFSTSDWCIKNLCIFLSSVDAIKYISNSDRDLIRTIVSRTTNLFCLSWFLYDDFEVFNEELFAKATNGIQITIDNENLEIVREKYSIIGYSKQFLDLNIILFNTCYDFYSVLNLYNLYIRPNLMLFNVQQLDYLLETINKNRAIYNCYSFNPSSIFEVYKSKCGFNPDLNKYPNLKSRFESFVREDSDDKNKTSDGTN